METSGTDAVEATVKDTSPVNPLDEVTFGDEQPEALPIGDAPTDAPAHSEPEIIDPLAPTTSPAGAVPFNAWYGTVFGLYLKQMGALSGLASLRGLGEGENGEREAAMAIYATCCELPALNFMVSGFGSPMVARLSAIAIWALPVVRGAALELKEKRQAKPKKAASGPAETSSPAQADSVAAEFDAAVGNG